MDIFSSRFFRPSPPPPIPSLRGSFPPWGRLAWRLDSAWIAGLARWTEVGVRSHRAGGKVEPSTKKSL